MRQQLRRTTLIGFSIGLIFTLIAWSSGLPVQPAILPVIPFIAALLSALGTLVSLQVSDRLSRSLHFHTPWAEILGFFAAALLNTVIVGLALLSMGHIWLHPGIVLGLLLGLLVGGLYGLYAYQVARMQEQLDYLKALNQKQQALQEAQRKLAITEERNRISRDLHDSVSQGIQGLLFTLHSLRKQLCGSSKDVQEMLDHIEATARSTLDELRTMIQELRPTLLTEEGLEHAIQIHVDLWAQRSHLPVHTEFNLSPALSPTQELALYRIVQEALANIEKHAEASEVILKLTTTERGLQLFIKDDGKGFIPGISSSQLQSGHGLDNMKRRVEESGGSLQIITALQSGTTLVALFPEKP